MDKIKERSKELRQETVICRIKYQNNLPELPFDPKLLTYPFEPSRFVNYASTSLERNHKHEILCETDVGVDVDIIDPSLFKVDSTTTLHPDDLKLLEDEDSNTLNERSARHQRPVAWLRKTEYLSTEHYNKFSTAEKIETKIGYNVKKRFAEEIAYRDRDSQIRAIESTFAAARKPIQRHYSKPGVHAVEVLPLLPDFKLWRYPCAQVIFDDDPSRKGPSAAESNDEVSQAVIRGMVDETGDHFVVYFTPTEETKRQRRLDAESHVSFSEGVTYEYEKTREYNWNVKNKTMTNYEENYFFVFRGPEKDQPAGVFYNELETRVRLSKRRRVTQTTTGVPQPIPSSKMRLLVQYRDFTFEELQAQTARLDMLLKREPSQEDDEDDGAASAGEGNRGQSDSISDNGEEQDQNRRNYMDSPPLDSPSPAHGRPKSSFRQHDSTPSSDEEDRNGQHRRRDTHGSSSSSAVRLRSTATVVYSSSEAEEDQEDESAISRRSQAPPPRDSPLSSELSNDEGEGRSSPGRRRYAPVARQVADSKIVMSSDDESDKEREVDDGDDHSPSPLKHKKLQSDSSSSRYQHLDDKHQAEPSRGRPAFNESNDDLSSLSD